MEAVAGEAAGVVLVLDEGSCGAIADVESDIAVIASELRISNASWADLLVLERGKRDRESLEHVVHAEHLSLQVKRILIGDVARTRGLRKEDGKPIAEQVGTLFVTPHRFSNLSTNSEFYCCNPFRIRKHLLAPAVSVLTLAIGSKTNEILVDHRISSALPIFDISVT